MSRSYVKADAIGTSVPVGAGTRARAARKQARSGNAESIPTVEEDVCTVGGGRKLVFLLMGTPLVVLLLPTALLGVFLVFFAGSDHAFRIAGAGVAGVVGWCSWIFWGYLTLKPLKMLASRERLQLWDGDELLVDI